MALDDLAAALRMEWQMLRARYDDGAMSPAIYNVIKELETDIAWLEHRRLPSDRVFLQTNWPMRQIRKRWRTRS
jgi:hypothetical protein